MSDCNVRVICRFRPVNKRELTEGGDIDVLNNILLFPDECNIQLQPWNNRGAQNFAFDRVFWHPSTTQEEVYELAARDSIDNLIKGFNATIFAYGQTGAGKSFTMFGPDISRPQDKGIIPRACEHIFRHIAADTEGTEYTIKCSFLEIYKEVINDLLDPSNKNLKVRETPSRGVWVDGLTEQFVACEDDVLDLIRSGEKNRAVASTSMNATSSRSHSLFILRLHQKMSDGSTKEGKLNLADLAGSEKVGKTGASGETLEEAKKINQSLSALGNCINSLTKGGGGKKAHVPYRDSKLTFILRESLGGNCKTTLLIACSPHIFNLEETISTLMFGKRAKTIKNKVTVNKQRSVAELMAIIERLKKELQYFQRYAGALEKALADLLGPDWKTKVKLPTQEAPPSATTTSPSSASLASGAGGGGEDGEPYDSEREDGGGSDSTATTPVSTPRLSREDSSVSLNGGASTDSPYAVGHRRSESSARAAFNVDASVALVELQVEMQSMAERHKLALDDLKDEVSTLSEERNTANAKIEEYKQIVSKLEDELKAANSQLADQRDGMEKASSKWEYESKQLLLQLDDKQRALLAEQKHTESLRERVKAIGEEHEQTKVALERVTLDYQRVEREKNEAESTVRSQDEKNTELLAKIDVLESKSAELRSQHLELSLKQKKITQQYDESLAALSAAQQQYKELDARFRAKTQLERELKEKLEEAESQVITLLRELDDTKSEIRMARQLNSEIQEEGERSITSLKESTVPNEEYQNVSSDARAIRQQLESARAGSKEMKQRIAALEADLETVSLDHKEALERMHKQHQIELGERDDRVELLEAQLKNKEEELQSKHTQWEAQLAEAAKREAAEKQKRRQTEQEADESKKALSEKKQRLEALEEMLREQKRELEEMQATADTHAKSIAMQAERIAGLEADLVKADQEKQQLLRANLENAQKFQQEMERQRLEVVAVRQPVGGPQRAANRGNVRVPVTAPKERSAWDKLFGTSLPLLSDLVNPIKYGLLFKRSAWFRRWDKRLVVLVDSMMYYFDSYNQAGRANGDIELDNCKVAIADEETGREFTFGIYHQSRSTVFLQASSEEERSEWMEAIRLRVTAIGSGGGQEMKAARPTA